MTVVAPGADDLTSLGTFEHACDELRRMVDDLLDAANADRGRTRVEPERMAPAALLRDPIADALQAIIPALREPVDLTDPPPAAPKAPTMTKDEIDRENERRIAAAVKRLL